MSEEGDQTRYLLDQKQFQKFYEFLTPRSNIDFVKKIQEKELIYSKKFYPISHAELETIKTHLKNAIDEKLASENEKIQVADDSSTVQVHGDQPPKEILPEFQNRKEEEEKIPEGVEKGNEISKSVETSLTQSFLWTPTNWIFFKIPSKKSKK